MFLLSCFSPKAECNLQPMELLDPLFFLINSQVAMEFVKGELAVLPSRL